VPKDPYRLTEWTSCGGCAAKWGPSPLGRLVSELQAGADPRLLVGLAPSDDAAVWQLSEELALVSTTDFFPPLVDDPAELPAEVVAGVLASAAAVVAEAGGVVAGGHTIRSDEPVYGLAVQGLVDPRRVWTKAGARPGQVLVLSKPLGTGLVLAGGSPEHRRAAVAGMRRLNREAAEALRELEEAGQGPGAVTDVTGFGLLGHAWEVAERSGATLRLDAGRLPAYPGALEAAARGVRTGGDARNRQHLAGHVELSAGEEAQALAFDPQTSGGLLASLPPAGAARLAGRAGFVEVGEVVPAPGVPGVALV